MSRRGFLLQRHNGAKLTLCLRVFVANEPLLNYKT
jgi:hypothetical protein